MMPKIANTNVGPDYDRRERGITRQAPYATNDTPPTDVKLIGGRLITIDNNAKAIRHNEAEELSADIQRFPNPEHNRSMLNPHHVLPPISKESDHGTWLRSSPEECLTYSNERVRRKDPFGLDRHLLGIQALPDKPVSLTLSEEVELRQRIMQELYGLSSQSLKQIYLELASFDPHLTGYVHFSDLVFAFLRNQVSLSVYNQRLVAAVYLSEIEPNKVNYEKVLYFLAACLNKNGCSMSKTQPPLPPEEQNLHKHRYKTWSGVDRTQHDISRELEKQLQEINTSDLDINRIWKAFQHADHTHTKTLSRNQIKNLCYQCKIPLDEDVLDHVIDKCHRSSDLFWWEQFLNFIGRYVGNKNSCSASEKRRPKDLVKSFSPGSGINMIQDHRIWERSSGVDRVTAIEKREREIARLEHIIQKTRHQLNERRRMVMCSEPWLDRFMTLAQAIYELDLSRTGYISAMEARWVTKEYSNGLELGLKNETIQTAIDQCTNDFSQTVPIEQFLRIILAKS